VTRDRTSFRQSDATRALRAALAAGLNPVGYSVAPDGSIKVEFTETPQPRGQNPLDRVFAK
jgi:hypothetical protein